MASLAADIDALFAAWGQPSSPGCAVLVARDGEPLYRRGHGLASLEHAVPITPSTVFNVGSISKQFTAMAILLLEAEGRVSLDDDVRRYVPELPDLQTPITLRHLLHHTSGLREQSHLLALAGWRDGDVVTERDVVDLVARQRGLMLGWPPAADEMIALGAGRFRVGATDVEAVFVPAPDGGARLEVTGSAREVESTLGPRVYSRRAAAHPMAEQLEDYAGRYESEEVGALEFVIGDGTLMARTGKGGDVPLAPTFADGFFDSQLCFYTFVRDPGDTVNAVHVTTDRIRTLPFTRRAMRVPLRFLRSGP